MQKGKENKPCQLSKIQEEGRVGMQDAN